VSWDEAFSHRYDEWAAEMTADIAFYVDSLERRTARSSSSPSGTAASRSLSRGPQDGA